MTCITGDLPALSARHHPAAPAGLANRGPDRLAIDRAATGAQRFPVPCLPRSWVCGTCARPPTTSRIAAPARAPGRAPRRRRRDHRHLDLVDRARRCSSEATRHRDLLDGVEIQLPNALVPDDACLAAIAPGPGRAVAAGLARAPAAPRACPGKAARADPDRLPPGRAGRARPAPWRSMAPAWTACCAALTPPRHPAERDAGRGRRGRSQPRIGAIDWAVEFAEATARRKPRAQPAPCGDRAS